MLYDLMVGTVAGVVSGAIVSFFISIVESQAQLKNDFSNEKQIYQRYIEMVRREVRYLIEAHNNKNYIENNKKDILDLLEEQPFTATFNNKYLTETSLKHIRDVKKKLTELQNALHEEEIQIETLVEISSNLLKVRINILMMELKETNKFLNFFIKIFNKLKER
ncbi:hypothetical protein KO561_02690 [Radiobacillus kanasensis]|uniref:hypothetical protein n=1 Tax=Radiobacillus kanasensis TaxID=2844358 RepID=UPI001E535F2C|nr:hypothetical protein [Radiobacillus kanasensis]UFT99888.1 hypothetical protein KO561_02690 [Radiobacillus kanasensis]